MEVAKEDGDHHSGKATAGTGASSENTSEHTSDLNPLALS